MGHSQDVKLEKMRSISFGVGEQPLSQDSRSGEFSKIHAQTLSQSHFQSKALGVGHWLRIQSARTVQVDGSNVRRNGWFRSIPASYPILEMCALTWSRAPGWNVRK